MLQMMQISHTDFAPVLFTQFFVAQQVSKREGVLLEKENNATRKLVNCLYNTPIQNRKIHQMRYVFFY